MSASHTGGSGGPHTSASDQGYRRLSYATVVAGSTASPFVSTTHSPSRPSSATTTQIPEREPAMSTSRNTHNTAGGAHADTSISHDRRVQSASWTSDGSRYGGSDCPPFFTPSYLASSRHVQRLRQAHEDYLAELHERGHRAQRPKPSLSTSSSSVNLGKMPAAHVHRGVAQDIIERQPPPLVDNDRLHPLPSRWSDEDKMNGLELLADGTEARFVGVTKTQDEAAAVRSDHPMPKQCGIYYYEVTILSRGKDGLIGIGFSSRKATLNRLPGWEAESWAYHGDDGYVFACTASGKAYGPRFAAQDVIGCGVNFRTGSAFFTKNGNYLGNAFDNIKTDRLYPSVGMKRPGEHLRVNFGKAPFVFDIDRLVEQERRTVFEDINNTDSSTLRTPDDENGLVHNLIGQYLVHEGYVETAKAFMQDVNERHTSLLDRTQQPLPTSDEDDVHAINRQKIRRSILDGDIDRALKYTNAYYPRLFEAERNKDIYFRLRCRKFIEMMRRYTELGAAASSPTTITKSVDSLGSNGHADLVEDESAEPPDTQMELDEQLQRETSRSLEPPIPTDDIDMDEPPEQSPKLSFWKADQLLSSVVKYGQELREEFGRDPRQSIQKQLQDIFAIMAYTHFSASPISHLFDAKGRAEIAEDINGAILVSLGKPSSAALEKLCAQTEAFLEETANKTGGSSAFVNVRKDFLQE